MLDDVKRILFISIRIIRYIYCVYFLRFSRARTKKYLFFLGGFLVLRNKKKENQMTVPTTTNDDDSTKITNWLGHATLVKPEPYKDDEGQTVWLCDQCGDEIPWMPDNADYAQISCEACSFTVCFECNGDLCAWMCMKCDRTACEACARIPEIAESFKETHSNELVCKEGCKKK